MSQARYIANRSVRTIFLLWLVMTFLFFFFKLMPGSFADMMVEQGASAEAVAELEEKWGLNDPLYVQYQNYVINFAQLDVGMSLTHRMPVWEYVKPRLLNTLVLALPAITASYIVGAVLGSLAGDKRGSPFERVIVTVVTIAGSFPGFFTGILAIVVFGVWIDIFPTSGMLSAGSTASGLSAYLSMDFLKHYILPFSVIVFYGSMAPTLIMRTSYTEVTGQDFAYFQKVSGLPYYNRVRHLGRHSILPLITLYPISLVNAVSALVLIELVFNWPGLGFALVQAIQARNFPVVQFVFFAIAALVIIANFAIDLFYGVIDPRISVGDDTQ